MRSIESEGVTIDEAIARALHTLGVARDQVRIDILEGDRPGLLGIGRRRARVRATIRPSLKVLLGDDGSASVTRSEAPVAGSAIGSLKDAASLDGADVVGTILRHMGVEATVSEGQPPPGRVAGDEDGGGPSVRALDVHGPGAAFLAARRGEVLEALEYVVNRILDHRGQSGSRVMLDADGHRDRRRAELEETARRMAGRARERRKTVTLEPLGPGDRRVIHEALRKERGVTLRSVGQGFYRKVLIIPEGGRRGGGQRAE